MSRIPGNPQSNIPSFDSSHPVNPPGRGGRAPAAPIPGAQEAISNSNVSPGEEARRGSSIPNVSPEEEDQRISSVSEPIVESPRRRDSVEEIRLTPEEEAAHEARLHEIVREWDQTVEDDRIPLPPTS